MTPNRILNLPLTDPRIISVLAAQFRSNIIAIPYYLGTFGLFLDADTGATVIVLSDNALRAVTRASPAPVQLLLNDLNIFTMRSNLRIFGKDHLALEIENKVCSFSTQFYVTTEFPCHT